MKYYYHKEKGLAVIEDDNVASIKTALDNGFYPVENYQEPPKENINFLTAVYEFDENKKVFVQNWIENIDEELLKTIQINELKKQLEDTDYVVIKQCESYLAGEKLPYSDKEFKEIVKTRKETRTKINNIKKGKK